MLSKLELGCLPTAIGSMPHVDPEKAYSIVMKYLPDIPAWPQLPKRSPKEDMCIQFSEGFPDVVTDNGSIHLKPSADFYTMLERIHIDREQDNPGGYGISAEYAAGLHYFLSLRTQRLRIVKGQVTGPVTWGLTVTDENKRPILHDETLAETVAKFLRLKASWQEAALRRISPNAIIFVDEPYLVSLGSVFASLPEAKIPALLEEVLRGIKGMKGLHCCGNTNWSVPLSTGINILSFDAYNYASSLSAYREEVKSFLGRGGVIAWGIVPSDEEALARESPSSLYDRLGEAMAPFTRNGTSFRQIIAQGLITPSCGLASLPLELAEKALELLAELSHSVRKKYAM
jgi:methionine synthase II (cobalamin-independent)